MLVKLLSSRQQDCKWIQTALAQIIFSSDEKFITGNNNGTVCLFINGKLKKTKTFDSAVPLVDFINGEVVVAAQNGSLTILTQDFETEKEFSIRAATESSYPWSLSGNEDFIAVGGHAGVVCCYERKGDNNPMVSCKVNPATSIDDGFVRQYKLQIFLQF